MINLYIAFDKVLIVTGIDIDELLGVAISEREPAALNLHHQPVAFFKSMSHVWDSKMDGFDFSRFEWFRRFKTFTKSSPHDFCVYEHFVPPHGIGFCRIIFIIDIDIVKRKGIGKYVNQFYNKISISTTDTY